MAFKRSNVRNIAIIAHVDHGKTTLVDEMLKQAGAVALKHDEALADRVMDSGDLEKERGITILAKNTSIRLPHLKINIVDTPGHMDFGGEVERTLQMVEGVLLLVDAAEGPLPGSRFVLQKALELDLKPIVFINKIDRKDADIERTEGLIQDLFMEVAVKDHQLDFPVLYGSSRFGFATTNPEERSGTMKPLFEAIEKYIPAPEATKENLQFLITSLDYSEYLGRIAIGRVVSGKINVNQQVICCTADRVSQPTKVTKVFQIEGLERKESESAEFGDIIAVAGFEQEISIGTTVCEVGKPDPLSYVSIDEPTLSMYLGVNTSPFAGREGNLLTSRQIRDRLYKELKTNVALRVQDTDSPETFKVSGRGQLHLGILVETMRREGFELQLSAPEVIYKDINGTKCEPFELLMIDIPEEHQGVVIEKLGRRRAIMTNMTPLGDSRLRLEFTIPSRGLIGFRSQFLTDTRGMGTLNSRFVGYEPCVGDVPRRLRGSLISMAGGSVTSYALDTLQARGILFVGPGTDVYDSMIIGEHNRDNDLEVNPVKEKKLTNVRASGTDEAVKLQPPKVMTLEESFDWIADDELIEVTPKSVRLRKRPAQKRF
ncbi:translational GTPase TypA [Candidatus Dependentiae bacterium]|nr:translational GTPase TypA [Candidatus Dependentiae bacterium]